MRTTGVSSERRLSEAARTPLSCRRSRRASSGVQPQLGDPLIPLEPMLSKQQRVAGSSLVSRSETRRDA